MQRDSVQLLYVEATRGRLGRYLDTNPELVNAAVAESLNQDFLRAAEYGDLGTAVIAVRACCEILDRIGEGFESVRLQISLLELQLSAAGSVDEFTSLRQSALTVGARAQDRNLPTGQIECWLLAIECARRLAALGPTDDRANHLVSQLRDLADVAELISEQPVHQQGRDNLARLAQLLASASNATYASRWDEPALLGMRALLKRAARAAERVIPRGLVQEIYENGQDALEADRRLMRLFREIDD